MNTAPSAFNLALVFPTELRARFQQLSELIGRSQDVSYALGKINEAHVTILQFEMASSAQEVWNRLSEVQPRAISIRLNGLCFLPSQKGGMWVEIPVTRSFELLAIQERALQALGFPRPLNKIGESYRPHITLARLPSISRTVEVEVECADVRAGQLSCTLALATKGEKFAHRHLL